MKTGIEEQLKSKGVKATAMRLWVYRELMQSRHPLSMKELEETMVTAERSTIFRTLTLFLQHKIIRGIEDGNGTLKYEICRGNKEGNTLNDQHAHFYCQSCQRTFCLHHISIPQPKLPEGFLPHSTNYMIKGLCPNCSQKD